MTPSEESARYFAEHWTLSDLIARMMGFVPVSIVKMALTINAEVYAANHTAKQP